MAEESFYLHKFRAAYARQLLRRGVDIATVRFLLGHKPDSDSIWSYLAVLRAAVLPRPLGHPYPARIEPYIVFGGILIYVVGGLCIVAFVRRLQGPSWRRLQFGYLTGVISPYHSSSRLMSDNACYQHFGLKWRFNYGLPEPEMKLFLYIAVGFLAMAAAAVLIAGGQQAPESNPAVLFALVALFAIPPVGAFWMMYMSIRYEKNPFRFVFLALIPFTFVWFYLERVRPGKLARNRDLA